uniref:Serine protease n=2 Tax=Amphora coffeiformis TaxID=265554 RepID=A0A6S8I3D4_9STRA|mmetsp:Transcript_9382/g.17892  ORF Transcript_9382/g.17892 Transcript_9382/m.17892 type:complete len:769 (+) Transcript_9382:170-2476(+)
MAARPSPVLGWDPVFDNKALRRRDSSSSLNSRRSSIGSTVSTPGEDSPVAEDQRRGNNRERSATWDPSIKDSPSKKSLKKEKLKQSRRLNHERYLKQISLGMDFPLREEESEDLRFDPPPDTTTWANSDRDTNGRESEPENDVQREISMIIRKCDGTNDEGHECQPGETHETDETKATPPQSSCKKKRRDAKGKDSQKCKNKNRVVLVLNGIKGMTGDDIPLEKLCGTLLGNRLTKLSLNCNPGLGGVPPQLVQSLPVLRNLHLSKCELKSLPEDWDLPQLRNLDLSHNRLTEFPGESVLQGLPELTDLNLSFNDIRAISIPQKAKSVPKNLKTLDLNKNFLEYLPEDLDRLTSLKVLLLKENFLKEIPKRVVEMNLDRIDVSENESLERPPLKVCVSETGLPGMREYFYNYVPRRPVPICTSQGKTPRSTTSPLSSKTIKKLSFGSSDYPTNSIIGGTVDYYNDEDKSESGGSSCHAIELGPGESTRRLLGAVVMVGLWDGQGRNVVGVGSGFVVDKKRGLIVTASHTLMNIADADRTLGEDYFGLAHGKALIGVIPESDPASDSSSMGPDVAVWRYYAEIVAKDPTMKSGKCHLDACVLRITSCLENDVDGDGNGCGDQIGILLKGHEREMSNKKLQYLKTAESVEVDEDVYVLGYGQGDVGLRSPDEKIKRLMDVAPGRVCKKLTVCSKEQNDSELFKPQEEIAICTLASVIRGHSGGPCVNQKGHVIGIVSRDGKRNENVCYLSPTSAWLQLVKDAQKAPVKYD